MDRDQLLRLVPLKNKTKTILKAESLSIEAYVDPDPRPSFLCLEGVRVPPSNPPLLFLSISTLSLTESLQPLHPLPRPPLRPSPTTPLPVLPFSPPKEYGNFLSKARRSHATCARGTCQDCDEAQVSGDTISVDHDVSSFFFDFAGPIERLPARRDVFSRLARVARDQHGSTFDSGRRSV